MVLPVNVNDSWGGCSLSQTISSVCSCMSFCSLFPPFSGEKGGAKTPARQNLSSRPCASSSAPASIRSRFVGAALRPGLPLHPPWRAHHPTLLHFFSVSFF